MPFPNGCDVLLESDAASLKEEDGPLGMKMLVCRGWNADAVFVAPNELYSCFSTKGKRFPCVAVLLQIVEGVVHGLCNGDIGGYCRREL